MCKLAEDVKQRLFNLIVKWNLIPLTDDEKQQGILQSLSLSRVGLTSRDIARRMGLRASEINHTLLEMQSRGLIERRGARWKSKSIQLTAGQISENNWRERKSRNTVSTVIVPSKGAIGSTPKVVEKPDSDRASIAIGNSRWAEFRRLCLYYAECVRLDQRSSIHAKAEEENEQVVCLEGNLPDADSLQIRTSSRWQKFMQAAATSEYLFIGYPLHRYRWKEPNSGDAIDFVSPIFVVPCKFAIENFDIQLEFLGSPRINEGWLERRFRNVEERKAFLTLVGNATADRDDEIGEQLNWKQCAQLLNHYYQDWEVEPLDPTRLASWPPLSNLSKDGIYNRAGLLVPRKLRYTNRLYEELTQLAHYISDDMLDRTALRTVFPHQLRKSSQPLNEQDCEDDSTTFTALSTASPLMLNAEQNAALKASASEKLSIVVGPPGTGKSRVVAATLSRQAIAGHQALFASRNHQALEAVVPSVNAITDPWPFMLRLARPWGAAIDHSLQVALSTLISSSQEVDDRRAVQLRRRLEERLNLRCNKTDQLEEIIRIRADIAIELFEWEDCLRAVPKEFRSSFRGELNAPSLESLLDCLRRIQGPGPARLSLRWLIKWIRYQMTWKRSLHQARQLDSCLRELFDTERILPAAPRDVKSNLCNYFARCLEFWRPLLQANERAVALLRLRSSLEEMPDLDSLCRELHALSIEAAQLTDDLCRNFAMTTGAGISSEERRDLDEVLKAIANQSGIDDEDARRQWERALRKAIHILLKHFPLMATTNLSVGRDIALEPGAFDLLIVDEASQCDVASVIPLLYRARRAMIVGDPMQLEHVTSLSAATDRLLRKQFRVDSDHLQRFSYRATSMFSLANSSPAVGCRTTLQQHHRCHPSIAEYCSDSFYKGNWIVLTDRRGEVGMKWTHVSDDSQPAPGGGATSRAQLAVLTDELQRLAAAGYNGTVGVVTPFRRQADLMRDRLHQVLDNSIVERWRLLVNTADGFQGDERDTVLLSLVAGPHLTSGSLGFLAAGPNRFNVAVSRAKHLLHVFGDKDWAIGCSIGHIRQLADACDRALQVPSKYDPENFRKDLVGPVWEPALAEALRAAGLPFFQQYPAGGRYLDFALMKSTLKLNVEVDGETYHRSATGGRVVQDIRRDQVLIADGWVVKRFWVYELREDMKRCVNEIAQSYEN